MPEFRTRAPGDYGEDSSSSSLENHIEKVINNVKNDPKLKAQLYQELKDNGVNPAIIRAVFPEAQALGEAQAQGMEMESDSMDSQAQAQNTDTEKPKVKTVTEKPTPEQLLGLIDEIADVVPNGKETTLEELKEMAEDNPDIVETAIELKL